MLMVSRSPQVKDAGSASAIRAWLPRALSVRANPIVATMFWHIDCVIAFGRLRPSGRFQRGGLRMRSASVSRANRFRDERRKISSCGDTGREFSLCTRVLLLQPR